MRQEDSTPALEEVEEEPGLSGKDVAVEQGREDQQSAHGRRGSSGSHVVSCILCCALWDKIAAPVTVPGTQHGFYKNVPAENKRVTAGFERVNVGWAWDQTGLQQRGAVCRGAMCFVHLGCVQLAMQGGLYGEPRFHFTGRSGAEHQLAMQGWQRCRPTFHL